MYRMAIVGIIIGLWGTSQACDKTARELHLIHMRTKVIQPYDDPTKYPPLRRSLYGATCRYMNVISHREYPKYPFLQFDRSRCY